MYHGEEFPHPQPYAQPYTGPYERREYPGPVEQGWRSERAERSQARQGPPRGSYPRDERQFVVQPGARAQEKRGVPDKAVHILIGCVTALVLYCITVYVLRGAAQAGFEAATGLIIAAGAGMAAFQFRANNALVIGFILLVILASFLALQELAVAYTLMPPLPHVTAPHHH